MDLYASILEVAKRHQGRAGITRISYGAGECRSTDSTPLSIVSWRWGFFARRPGIAPPTT
jgi:hypothetical protein